jgi:hypothetical protein
MTSLGEPTRATAKGDTFQCSSSRHYRRTARNFVATAAARIHEHGVRIYLFEVLALYVKD